MTTPEPDETSGYATGIEDVDDDRTWTQGMQATCHVCGCTENEPCDGGCTWVRSSLEIDLCSACAAAIARDAVADGTYTPQLHQLGSVDTDAIGRSPAAHRVRELIATAPSLFSEDVRTLSREHDALLQLTRLAAERHRQELTALQADYETAAARIRSARTEIEHQRAYWHEKRRPSYARSLADVDAHLTGTTMPWKTADAPREPNAAAADCPAPAIGDEVEFTDRAGAAVRGWVINIVDDGDGRLAVIAIGAAGTPVDRCPAVARRIGTDQITVITRAAGGASHG